jgi:hypothetical protein
MPSGTNRRASAAAVGGLFFPQSKGLGIDLGHYSPAVLQRVVYAGVHCSSYELAHVALEQLADLEVSTKQVERLTKQIGTERCGERDAEVKAYQQRPLVERKSVPEGVTAPKLAVVQMDGGRLQILDRSASKSAGEPSPTSHWREDKVGLLATMTSEVHASDPCPTIPEHFVDPSRIVKLAREIKGGAGVSEADVTAESPSPDAVPADTPTSYLAPSLEQRSVVATRAEVHEFGGILAEAAWARGFYGATRQAFIADGIAGNWGVWERHFSSFTPIVDFIHALTYVFQGAMAGQSFAAGWTTYTRWIGQLWAGQVEAVIAALTERQQELGLPAADEAETSPRNRVAESLGYLRNQKERMRYGEYRQQGLPITSSHIESTIKRINQRVKGTEKFWSESGAEAILQLRADYLSETDPMPSFWKRRQAMATGERRHSNAI